MIDWSVAIPTSLLTGYPDLFTRDVVSALNALASFDEARQALMRAHLDRLADRAKTGTKHEFADPDVHIGGTTLTVQNAREGKFAGCEIPHDLRRQWIQGAGPAAKPHAPLAQSLRTIAYALLSGADGWMFDGEDALGQVSTMSLDNQRHLKLAIDRDDRFVTAAEDAAIEMNRWAVEFFGRAIVDDWRHQLELTTKIFQPRGLHLADRHIRHVDGTPFSASLVDVALFVGNNHRALHRAGSSIVLALPKIQTADEAAYWNDILVSLERHLRLPINTIKTYVLVEQIEVCFELMEIRAALRGRLVGYNVGRWSDHNVGAEDRVRRAANTPDQNGRSVTWLAGMAPSVPALPENAACDAAASAVAAAERECAAGASGTSVPHWKMVHIVRPVWERHGENNQTGRVFPPLTYSAADEAALFTDNLQQHQLTTADVA
jgi:malate synthase